MENSNHVWNIVQALWLIVGTAAIVKIIIDGIVAYNKEKEIYHPPPTPPDIDLFEEQMYHHGFVFCNVFKTEDIHMIARKMGVALTKPDVIEIIHAIKKDFTIAVGIDRHRIEMYIRIIVKRNIQKQ